MEKRNISSPSHWAWLTLLCLLFLCSSKLYAQRQFDDSWKNAPITLRISNEPLNIVLEKVVKQAGATLEFQDVALVGNTNPTSLNVKDMPLDKVLGRLIGDQNVLIRYESGLHVVVSPYQKATQSKNLLTVEGSVTDAKTGEPLVGATIVVTDGTKDGGVNGSITDVNGKFSLQVPAKSSIKVSYMGYETLSLQITRKSVDLKIKLKEDGQMIGEVVVTGLSKRSKSSFTGNYVSVKGDELRKLNPNNILKSLQFYDPSFKVLESNTRGSDPNAQPEFLIRGDQNLGTTASLNSMDLLLDNVSSRPNTPLFVLDGFIVSMSRVLQLDPELIENVTILKDAAATAIYGSRASNGVVVIETKVAPDGVLSVNYNGGVTVQAPDLTDYELMNAQEKLQMEWDAGVYDPTSAQSMNVYNRLLRNVLAGVDTYWLSKPLRTAIAHRHTLTAAGGTEAFRYSLSVNGTSTPGVMKGSSQDLKSLNFSMTYRKEELSVGANINLAGTTGHNSPYGSFAEYTRVNPYYRPTNDYGEYLRQLDNHTGSGSVPISNPLYNAHVGIKDFSTNTNISANLNLEYRLWKSLRMTGSFSYLRGMARTERFLPADHTSFLTELDKTLRGSYAKNTGEMESWSSNIGFNWNGTFQKHLLSVFGNWTVTEDKSNYINLFAKGYPDSHMDDFLFGNKLTTTPSGSEAISRTMGFITQLSYSYDNKYSVDVNVSSEITSRYADHHLTPFWSIGARWNAYREKWLAGRVSNLVFRATYGITGSQNSSQADAIEYYTFSSTMRPYTSFATLGAVLSRLNNPEIKWTKTDNMSLGVDLGVWKNRINLSFNYYNNISRQLLTNYDLAPSTGFESLYINAGELQNKGFDATLSIIALQNLRKQFYWTVAVGMNHNRNKIRKISEYLRKMNEEQLKSKSAPLPIYQEGKSTTTYYAVRSLGIDPMTGKEVYLTKNGEKTFVWDPADKVPVGETTPKVSGTISSSVNWHDFSCTLGFMYKWGGIVYNQTLVDKIENSNIAYNLDRRAAFNRWHKPGDVAKYKKIDLNGSETPASDRFIMKDNELRLASINLGYRFKQTQYKLLRRLSIDVLSLNFTTNDLLRFSTVKMERGLSYPFSRSYTLSFSIIFK